LLINKFLSTNEAVPSGLTGNEQDKLIQEFQSKHSGLAISGLSEFFFEKGKEFEKVNKSFLSFY